MHSHISKDLGSELRRPELLLRVLDRQIMHYIVWRTNTMRSQFIFGFTEYIHLNLNSPLLMCYRTIQGSILQYCYCNAAPPISQLYYAQHISANSNRAPHWNMNISEENTQFSKPWNRHKPHPHLMDNPLECVWENTEERANIEWKATSLWIYGLFVVYICKHMGNFWPIMLQEARICKLAICEHKPVQQ